jgi:hypothetical protein
MTIPTSPLDRRLDRISRACERQMIDITIVRKEVHDLRAANEKEKQKRRRSTKRIVHEGGLTRQEAQDLIQSQNQSDQSSQPVANNPAQPEHVVSQPRVRAPQKCSGCGIIGHNIFRCPSRVTS